MGSRQTIIERIRQNKPETKPLPGSFTGNQEPVSKEQLSVCFRESLIKAGAEIAEPDGNEGLEPYKEKHFPEAVDLTDTAVRKKYSSEISKKELEKTGTVIIEGQFGVAENGAIWLDETNFPNRLLPFIAERLIILLNKENIVSNMHGAYRKIDLRNTGFGVFISGPSKTADIEQSLVYGAHGAKRLTIVLFD
ncbi:MAG: hypothetical protein A2W90_22980 [Bacteroidetes bacterium GWF2_42_66]|nr:MAG: hypothetical protein A2W92_02790 [Bacteroidetes bacterium GWA2_42_15]OFX99523.1 MAG: hypothetical protein A2W89_12665 [Bacteroidetes bacterium GWE2_42_39]OFY47190.1 MAG: hypothetical protein A2W90_22980 [Bacteroidetes bacterium GWF2_42_66]HBL76840.1 L-lactate dehydrogenase [Prolixibacteraceae bacterium]HCR88901.1 L-lactate dehydrogenase [Prolixibacteraceae bacterium]